MFYDILLYDHSKDNALKEYITSTVASLSEQAIEAILGNLIGKFLEEDDVVFGLNLEGFIEKLKLSRLLGNLRFGDTLRLLD